MRRVVIIGGGPGGYPAAIQLAKAGLEVTLIEKEKIGGTCLNKGCIPTKALIQSAKRYREIEEGKNFGVLSNGQQTSYSWDEIQKYKHITVEKLVTGLKSLLKQGGVTLKWGKGKIVTPKKIVIEETGEKIIADAIILSTGSEYIVPPIPGIEMALTSDEILQGDLSPLPSLKLAVIGGGVIGVEIAQVYALLGAEVTIFELLPEILPGFDNTCVKIYKKYLEGLGINFHTNVQVEALERVSAEGKFFLYYRSEKQIKKFESDKILLATGRKPFFEGSWDTKIPITVEKGAIYVDNNNETSVEGIFATGDCTGGVMLAHKAMIESEKVAKGLIYDTWNHVEPELIPKCVYGKMEFASVGVTFDEAVNKWGKEQVKLGRFPMLASGMATILGASEGMAQAIIAGPYEEIVGIQILSPHAVDLISTGILAIQQECTVDEFEHLICPHPSLSESLREAVLDAKKIAVHIP